MCVCVRIQWDSVQGSGSSHLTTTRMTLKSFQFNSSPESKPGAKGSANKQSKKVSTNKPKLSTIPLSQTLLLLLSLFALFYEHSLEVMVTTFGYGSLF